MTIKDLYLEVIKQQGLSSAERERLLDDVRKLQPPEGNRWNFRYVIFALALLALSVPIYALWQLAAGKPATQIPDALLSVAATGVGALAGFMTQASRNGGRDDETKSSADPTAGP